MGSESVVGIPFNYDDSWIGGTYYVKNLISSLNLLPEGNQPFICLISHSRESYEFISTETGYKKLEWLKPGSIADIDGGISRRVRWKQALTPGFLKRKYRFDLIYPYPLDTRFKKTACWIPDFQEKYFPEFFSAEELKSREQQHRYYFNNFDYLVFSSEVARKDFHRFYPEAAVKTHVIRFSVFDRFLTLEQDEQDEAVFNKYSIDSPYFYCPNQFWIHKNHEVVLIALKQLKMEGFITTVVFSGKEHDHRAPGHADKLRKIAKEYGIEDMVRFVGFIPRPDQISIFKGCRAVIQPSLFEGWSTVIEDAKSLSKYVIASDIAPNREQIRENAEFFDPRDSYQLAKILKQCIDKPPIVSVIDYNRQRIDFAKSFITLLDHVKSL